MIAFGIVDGRVVVLGGGACGILVAGMIGLVVVAGMIGLVVVVGMIGLVVVGVVALLGGGGGNVVGLNSLAVNGLVAGSCCCCALVFAIAVVRDGEGVVVVLDGMGWDKVDVMGGFIIEEEREGGGGVVTFFDVGSRLNGTLEAGNVEVV